MYNICSTLSFASHPVKRFYKCTLFAWEIGLAMAFFATAWTMRVCISVYRHVSDVPDIVHEDFEWKSRTLRLCMYIQRGNPWESENVLGNVNSWVLARNDD